VRLVVSELIGDACVETLAGTHQSLILVKGFLAPDKSAPDRTERRAEEEE